MSLWINFNPMNHPGPIGHLHQPPWSRWCWLGSSQPREWILWVYQDQPVKVVKIPWWFPQPFSKQDAKIHLMIMNDHWWFIFYVRWFSMVFYHFDPFCIIHMYNTYRYSTDVQEISAGMAQLGSSALGAPRNYPFETHGINMAILGAEVPTQLHGLEEVASFTKKKIVDFKLRWMTDGWMTGSLTLGKQWKYSSSFAVLGLGKGAPGRLNMMSIADEICHLFAPKTSTIWWHQAAQDGESSSSLQGPQGCRSAERNGRFDDFWRYGKNQENKKPQKNKCIPEVFQLSCALIYYVHDLSSQGVEGELPSIKDVMWFPLTVEQLCTSKSISSTYLLKSFSAFWQKDAKGSSEQVIFFWGPLLASQRDVGMPRFLSASPSAQANAFGQPPKICLDHP